MVEIALIILMVVFLTLSAFCSGSETGFMSVSRWRLMHLSREGSRAAKMLQKYLGDLSRTVTSILIGNNIANVIFSSASAAFAARMFSETKYQTLWACFAASLVLYLGEFLPKLFFSSRPLSRLLKMAPFFNVFAIVLSPLTNVALWLTSRFVGKTDEKEKVTINDLVRILQDRKDGVRLTDFESALISRILVLRRKGELITTDSILRALDDE